MEEAREAEKRAEERRKREEEEARATKAFAQKEVEVLRRQLDEVKRKKELKRSRPESETEVEAELEKEDWRVHHDGQEYRVEDEGREDLRGVPEEGTEVPLAGGDFAHQGLPLVQCLESQVRRAGGGVGGWAFEEEKGGHG